MSERPAQLTIRPAVLTDHHALALFLNTQPQVHRHLDWRTGLEWLGSRPFYIAENKGSIEAVLACPPDPADVAWVRLFCADDVLARPRTWRRMLVTAAAELKSMPDQPVLAAISLQDWFTRLLSSSGFEKPQDIVVLEWGGQMPPLTAVPPEVTIRKMRPEDLAEVQRVDWQAFEPLWQNSVSSLELAFEQSAWSTVAEINQQIIGYQISTAVSLTGHLARLAVLPDLQRGRIGYALVRDMLRYFIEIRAWRVTVNTQSNNASSLALYEKTGFRRTGEEFPVFRYPQ